MVTAGERVEDATARPGGCYQFIIRPPFTPIPVARSVIQA